jgi:hypothetical protein
MAVWSSATLLKTPQRMRSSVISPKKRSIWLSQEAEVGVKCMWNRGCLPEPGSDPGMFVRGVVVGDQVHVEMLRRLGVGYGAGT